MNVEVTVLGDPIRAEIEQLDEGWDVAVYGGVRTHVGAVSLSDGCGGVETLQRPGHRDAVISERWAARLAEAWRAPVCVRCGIHHHEPTRAQLAEIVAACDALLEKLIFLERCEEVQKHEKRNTRGQFDDGAGGLPRQVDV